MKRLLFSLFLTVMLVACDDPKPAASGGGAPANKPAPAAGQPAAHAADKIKFKAADASKSFSIKLREDGAKLVDGSENELARITVDSTGKLKVKDAADKPLAYVTGQSPQWHLKNAEQTQVLFQLVRQDDGDLKFQDGAGKLLYRIKKRDYGAEVETPDDKSLFKSKQKEGKLSIRDASDKAVLATNDSTDPQAAALLVIEDLTLPQRVVLWYALAHPAPAVEAK